MKIGVLTNPLSRRNQRDLPRLRDFLRECDDVIHIELNAFSSLEGDLRRLAALDVGVIVINGGDGTVSAVLTAVYGQELFPSPPLLAVSPGGTSNTIAGDVGLQGDRIQALKRLIDVVMRDDIQDHIETRSLLRVDVDRDRPAVFGMFLGTAAICDAITLRRRLFPQKWLPDALAGALTLLYVLSRVLVGRPNAGGLLPDAAMSIVADGESLAGAQYTLVIVSTLRRIFLGSSPFWNQGEGGLKYTNILSPATGLVRNAYRLLYGRDKSRLPSRVYQSGTADKMTFKLDCPLNLDGEFIYPSSQAVVHLSASTGARFLKC